MAGGLAAIVAVSFGVAFAVGLASPARDQRPQTTVVRVPAGGSPSRLVADRGGLRPVAALPALRVPPAPTPRVTPAPVTAAAPAPTAAPPAAPAPAPPAPAPVAPVQAPPAPPPADEPPERGPVFDSEG